MQVRLGRAIAKGTRHVECRVDTWPYKALIVIDSARTKRPMQIDVRVIPKSLIPLCR